MPSARYGADQNMSSVRARSYSASADQRRRPVHQHGGRGVVAVEAHGRGLEVAVAHGGGAARRRVPVQPGALGHERGGDAGLLERGVERRQRGGARR